MHLLYFKKHYFKHFCCLFLKLSKAFSVSLKEKAAKNFPIFTGKHLCWRPLTLFKRDSNRVVFLWIMRSFQNHLFWRACANSRFWTGLIASCYHDFLYNFWTNCSTKIKLLTTSGFFQAIFLKTCLYIIPSITLFSIEAFAWNLCD